MTDEKKTDEVVDELMGISVPGVSGSFAMRDLRPRRTQEGAKIAAGHTPKIGRLQVGGDLNGKVQTERAKEATRIE